LAHAQSVARQSRAATAELKRELARRTTSALSDVIERELRMHERVLGGEAVERVHSRLGRDTAPPVAPPEAEAEADADPGPARVAAPAPAAPPPASPTPPTPPASPTPPAPAGPVPETGPGGDDVREAVVEAVAAQLYLAPHEVDARQTFSDMGLDSIGAVEVTNTLATRFGVHLESVLVYECPTVPELADAVAAAVRHRQQVTEAALAPAPEAAQPAQPKPQSPDPTTTPTPTPPPGPDTVRAPVEPAPGTPGPVVNGADAPGPAPSGPPPAATAPPSSVPPLVLRGASVRDGRPRSSAPLAPPPAVSPPPAGSP